MIKVVKDEWTPFVQELQKLNIGLTNIVPRVMRSIIAMWVRRAQGITRQLGLIKTGYYLDAHKFSSGRVNRLGKSTFTMEFGNDAYYAGFLEEGTRAHGPKHAKYLVWRGGKGELIFAKWVRGIKPYRVWGKAVDNTENLIRNEWDKAIPKELERMRKSAIKGFEGGGYRKSFE
jgi:hypothetical protein